MIEENVVIKTEHLSKEYKLGVINTGTLRRDIQSHLARLRGKEDPNSKIGSNSYEKGEVFLALDDFNVEIKRGERVGIIGANGAGKSTFLKLLSHITAPSKGKIQYRGRIASMLEVGTGFHGELTGRENVYLNGAILGMSKSEVDAKIDQIIEFSECEQFIDTPVKRYSSGMFVKLAFSVAAHLDAEIMIMDEVLAVGDMKFQKKCLKKMRDLAVEEDRTILYVSHNMDTIQELCSRCLVLDHGKKVFDGAVEEAIKQYLGGEKDDFISHDYTADKDDRFKENVRHHAVNLTRCAFNGITSNLFTDDEKVPIALSWENLEDVENLGVRIEIDDYRRYPVTSFVVRNMYSGKKGESVSQRFLLDVSKLSNGVYYTRYIFFRKAKGSRVDEDVEIAKGLVIRRYNHAVEHEAWLKTWGSYMSDGVELID